MNLNQSNVMAGKGTQTFTIGTAGVYKMSCRSTEIPPSGLTITLSQSGSVTASYSYTILSPLQNNLSGENIFLCAVGDVLTCALTSSNTIDNLVSNIKSVITLNPGN